MYREKERKRAVKKGKDTRKGLKYDDTTNICKRLFVKERNELLFYLFLIYGTC